VAPATAANLARDAQQQAVGDAVGMWTSILAKQRQIASGIPSLRRQVSVSGASAVSAATLVGLGGNTDSEAKQYGLSDFILQFIKSDTEIDPAVAAAQEKAKANRNPAMVVVEEQEPIRFRCPVMTRCLLRRRERAQLRTSGLLSFARLASLGALRSVQLELMRYLAPALRDDLESLNKNDDSSDSKHSGSGSSEEDSDKSAKPVSSFHYTDGTLGCGTALADDLSAAFQELFGKLCAILKQQLAVILTSDVSPSADALAMSVLACWGMNFNERDHRYLDQTGAVHLLRKVIELETKADEPGTKSKTKKGESQLNSRQRLRETGWSTFRLLALSGFQRDATTQPQAMATRPIVSETPTADLARQGELSQFQSSLAELTLSLIKKAVDLFLDSKKYVPAPSPKAAVAAHAGDTHRSQPETATHAAPSEPALDGDVLVSQDESEAKCEADSDADQFDQDGLDCEGDADAHFAGHRMPPGGFGDFDESIDPMGGEFGGMDFGDSPMQTEDPEEKAAEEAAAALNAPEQTCFGMLRLLLGVLGSSKQKRQTRVDDAEDGERKQTSTSDDESQAGLLRFLAAAKFVPLLFTLLQNGTPRIQRTFARLLRRLLPLQSSAQLALPVGTLCVEQNAVVISATPSSEGAVHSADEIVHFFISLAGRLLLESGNATGVSELVVGVAAVKTSSPERTSQISFALASEIIALLRSMLAQPAWFEPLKTALIQGINHVPAILAASASTLPTMMQQLQLATVAITVVGGTREVLRVGGKVHVFSSQNRKKRKPATLVALDPIAGSAQVVYDAATQKKVDILPKDSLLTAVEEVPYDGELLSLSAGDDSAAALLRCFDAVLTFTQKPTSSSNAEAAESKEAAPTPAHLQSPLAVQQLVSRAGLALAHALAHRASALTVLHAGFGPKLAAIAQIETPIPIGDPTSAKFEDLERSLARLSEVFSDAKMLLSLPEVANSADNMSMLLPYSPFRNLGVRLPYAMQTDSQMGVCEDEDKCMCVTTGRVRAWEDWVIMWSDVPIPTSCPCFYFEMTVVSKGDQGQCQFGLLPANKPKKQAPGIGPSIGVALELGVMYNNQYFNDHLTAKDHAVPQKGDVFGLLINNLTGMLSIVRNGKVFKDVRRISTQRRAYHPALGISGPGFRVQFNFGQRPFRWNVAASKIVPKEFRVGDLKDDESDDESDLETDGVSAQSKAVGGLHTAAAAARREAKVQTKTKAEENDPIALKKRQALKADDGDADDEKDEKESRRELPAPAPNQPSIAEVDEKCVPDTPAGPIPMAPGAPPQLGGDDEKERTGREQKETVDDQDTQRNVEDDETKGTFDAWQSESDFSDDFAEDDDDDQDEDSDEDQHYGYRRNQPKKAAGPPPLTVEGVHVGDLLYISEIKEAPPVPEMDQWGNPLPVKKPKKKARKTVAKAGLVVEIDQARRRVQLRLYDSETALSTYKWYGVSELERPKPQINADLYQSIDGVGEKATAKPNMQALLLTAMEQESTVATVYLRSALLSLLQQHSTLGDAAIAQTVKAIGGPRDLLSALKRAALDEFSENSYSGAGDKADDDDEVLFGGAAVAAGLQRPLDVFRRFVLTLLRAMDDEAQEIRLAMAALLKTEAVEQLSVGTNARMSWREKLKTREHVEFGCWLVDLLLSADVPVKRKPHRFVDARPQHPAGSLGCFSTEIFDALVAIFNVGQKLKPFKPTTQMQLVVPLLVRMLHQVLLFPASAAPDLSRLEWLVDRVEKRYAEEIKHLGKDAAVSKNLQALVNLVLATKKAREDRKESEAPKTASEEKAADSPEFLDVGPEFEKLSWLEQTCHVAEIMQRLESGRGVDESFLRTSWCQMQTTSQGVVGESSHPYSADVAWTEVHVPAAQALTIRLDPKSKTDPSDRIIFAIPASQASVYIGAAAETKEPSDTSTGTSEGDASKFEVAVFSGPNMLSTGGGPAVDPDETDFVKIKGNKLFYRFEQSTAPSHQQVFCSLCEFPIRGTRYCCATCDTDLNSNNQDYYNQSSTGVSICEACEKNLQDTGRHDRSHIWLQIKRPMPAGSTVPRPIPSISTMYEKDILKQIKSGDSPDHLKHAGVTCTGCGQSDFDGIRFKCAYCPDMDLCANCEAQPAHQHDRSHPIFKIRFPIKTTSTLKSPLKGFVDQLNEDENFWGFKFTVSPQFSNEHLQALMRQHKAELDGLSARLAAAASIQRGALNMDTQVVEMVNRTVDRLVNVGQRDSSNTSPRGGYRGRGGRRMRVRRARARYDIDQSNDTTDGTDQIPITIDPKFVLDDKKQLVLYQHLQNLELDEVYMRMSTVKLLNARLKSVLPLIDWSLVRQPWSLSYVFGRLRGLIFSQLKMKMWNDALQRTRGRGDYKRRSSVVLDNHKASRARDHADEMDILDVIDCTLFGQLFQQLRKRSPSELRVHEQPWNTRYKQEQGIDAGGLFRDSLSQICQELQSPHVPLFIACPNARHGVGITLDKYIPNPSCDSELFLAMFEFVGRLMGVAIRTNNSLSLDLPSLVWKPLVGMDLEEGDLTAVDQVCMNAMDAMLDDAKLEEKGVNAENFHEVYGLTFAYSSSDETIIELKEGGKDIPVTWDDRENYVKLVKEFRLGEFTRQVAAIRRGLTAIIPARFLSLLTWKELELEVCGSPEIDIELLKQNTVYRHCSSNDPHIVYFWAVLEKFSQMERAQFLRFAWGRSRLPPANKFVEKLKIDTTNHPETHLPLAHTCFFSIELPRYRSEEQMREKLIKAITMCTSMELA